MIPVSIRTRQILGKYTLESRRHLLSRTVSVKSRFPVVFLLYGYQCYFPAYRPQSDGLSTLDVIKQQDICVINIVFITCLIYYISAIYNVDKVCKIINRSFISNERISYPTGFHTYRQLLLLFLCIIFSMIGEITGIKACSEPQGPGWNNSSERRKNSIFAL